MRMSALLQVGALAGQYLTGLGISSSICELMAHQPGSCAQRKLSVIFCDEGEKRVFCGPSGSTGVFCPLPRVFYVLAHPCMLR